MQHAQRQRRTLIAQLDDVSEVAGSVQDDSRDLDAGLARLAPAARACMVLAYQAGMSHGEIAEALKLPRGTVKTHISRSTQLLRQWFGVQKQEKQEKKQGMLDPFLIAQFVRNEPPPDMEALIVATVRRVHSARRRRSVLRAVMFLLAALVGTVLANSGMFVQEVVALNTTLAGLGQVLALPWVWALTVVALLSGRTLAHAGRGDLHQVPLLP